jgi:2'-hydroxyisoflavone reductase
MPERRTSRPPHAARSRTQSRSNVCGPLPLALNVLILGGTLFLGRHLVRELCERGHSVATFTRGRTAADDGFSVTRYIGDRDGELAAIPRDGWDAVIDTSAHWPSWVAASAAHLARTKRYLYTSSISVYDIRHPEIGDGICPYEKMPPNVLEGDMEGYGPFKRRSEDVVRAVFGDERALIVRPGLIVGPNDPTDRFTYWVERGADGGVILAPGTPNDRVQFIDVRDLARFMVRLLEDERTGTYDVTSAPGTITIGNVIAASTALPRERASVVWADGAWLETRGLEGWIDLPLWLAPKLGLPGLMNARVDRAVADGLTLRPLADTIAATRAWLDTLPDDRERHAGISRERERELLGEIAAERG